MMATEAPPQNEANLSSSVVGGGGDDSDQQTTSIMSMLQTDPPPDPLPDGWIMHRSRSQTGYAYYFNQFTGECKWDPPYVAPKLSQLEGLKETLASLKRNDDVNNGDDTNNNLTDNKSSVKSILKQSTNNLASEEKSGVGVAVNGATSTPATTPSSPPPSSSHKSKRPSRSDRDRDHHERSSKRPRSSSSSNMPEKVRALHILKKHRESRRPSSWKQAKITISKKQAVEELKELISILQDVAGDPTELRATFEELAKSESDCTSAKRGGDLGFFGRKKMQPNFEKASFALRVGEMSSVVETSSGVHVILRLA